jgi:hypothetical protein
MKKILFLLLFILCCSIVEANNVFESNMLNVRFPCSIKHLEMINKSYVASELQMILNHLYAVYNSDSDESVNYSDYGRSNESILPFNGRKYRNFYDDKFIILEMKTRNGALLELLVGLREDESIHIFNIEICLDYYNKFRIVRLNMVEAEKALSLIEELRDKKYETLWVMEKINDIIVPFVDPYVGKPDEFFANMQYQIGNTNNPEYIQLRGGHYYSVTTNIFYEDQYVMHDFNGDSLEDAAVLLLDSAGSSAQPFIAFLINENGKYVHRASAYMLPRTDVHSLKLREDKLIVDMSIRKDFSPNKIVRMQEVYEYGGPNNWHSVRGQVLYL